MVIIQNAETGEYLKTQTERQYKRQQKKKKGTSKKSKAATAAKAASIASGAVAIGTAIWSALTPEQKQAIINGGKKAVRTVVGWFKKKVTSKSNNNQNIIPTSGGQFTTINKPAEPRRKNKGVSTLPPLF